MENAKNQFSCSSGIPLHYFAWIAASVPLLTTHCSFLIAAGLDHIEWCNPYWANCVSISATGRQLPEKLWFKFGMLPAALNIMILWWGVYQWQKTMCPVLYKHSLLAMFVIGVTAALFLFLYTLALGEQGAGYNFIRRAGVILAFSLTYIAQLLLTRLIGEAARNSNNPFLLRWHRRLFVLVVLLLAIGLISVILETAVNEIYDNVKNAFEWVMALLLNAYFAFLAIVLSRQAVFFGLISTWRD